MADVCVCVCVSRLPEVGDLLLSMSMDCWLSESSVRPAVGNGGRKEEEVEYTQFVRICQHWKLYKFSRSRIGWCQPRRAPRKKLSLGYSTHFGLSF